MEKLKCEKLNVKTFRSFYNPTYSEIITEPSVFIQVTLL